MEILTPLAPVMERAVANFDAAKEAIIRNGVEVPNGTPVEDYWGKLDDIRKPPEYKIFGVRWHKTEPPSALTRLYDSTGFTFAASVGTTAGGSSFDNQPVYKDIKLCNLSPSGVATYQGEAGFSRTPATGDVMVEIPKFYIKIDYNNPLYTDFLICDKKPEGFITSPAHMDRGDGKGERDKIYVGIYTSNTAYRSLSGNASAVSRTRAQFRTGHTSRGSGYYTMDFAAFWTIGLLYLVEVADWNSQTKVGAGYTNAANITQINTGGADNVAWHSGRATTNANANQNAVKYRHLENLWGNIIQWIDGINSNGTSVYVGLNPAQFADNVSVNYRLLSYLKSGTDGFTSELGYDYLYPWAMCPTAVNGSSSTFVTDSYSRLAGWGVLCIGGHWPVDLYGGLFYLNMSGSSAYAEALIGSRIMYLP